MIKNGYLRIFLFSLLVFVLMGCKAPPSPTSPEITVLAPSPTVPENGYPAPTAYSAYPAPSEGGQQLPPVTKVVETAIPQTPDPNLALVKGRILLVDKPVSSIILYLANVISSETGGRMVRFDRTTSVRTVTDEQGYFTFINVPPGEYGLVFDRVIDSYLLLTPEGDNFILTITGSEQIDLGELNYEDLPIPKEP